MGPTFESAVQKVQALDESKEKTDLLDVLANNAPYNFTELTSMDITGVDPLADPSTDEIVNEIEGTASIDLLDNVSDIVDVYTYRKSDNVFVGADGSVYPAGDTSDVPIVDGGAYTVRVDMEDGNVIAEHVVGEDGQDVATVGYRDGSPFLLPIPSQNNTGQNNNQQNNTTTATVATVNQQNARRRQLLYSRKLMSIHR